MPDHHSAFFRVALVVALSACGSTSGGERGNETPQEPLPADPVVVADAGGTSTTPINAGSLTITTKPVVTLRRGKNLSVDVTIVRNGFDGAVALTIAGLASGVSTKPSQIQAGESRGTLVLEATEVATLGKATAMIVAHSADLVAKTPIEIVVAESQGLDSTFGKGGMLNFSPDTRDRASYSLDVQPDAKIVVGCQFSDTAEQAPLNYVGGVYRFTDAGDLDTSFGKGGLVQIPAFGGGIRVKLQADGKMVACGTGKVDKKLTLARLDSQGTLDASFGSGGLVKGAPGLENCLSLGIDASGRSVVVSHLAGAAVIARYLPSGLLDPSFGSGGVTTTKLGGKTTTLRDVRITPQGLLFTGSRQMEGTTSVSGIVARMTDTGTPDSTFGTGGVYDNMYGVFEVIPLTNGSMLVGISTDVLRLTTQGTVDPAYELDKSSFPRLPGISAVDDQQTQYRFHWQGSNWIPELRSYKADGALDTSFASGGRIIMKPGRSTNGQEAVLTSDGRLVVLASPGNTAFWLARFVL